MDRHARLPGESETKTRRSLIAPCQIPSGGIPRTPRNETQDPPRQPSNLAKSNRITPSDLQRGKIHDRHNDQPAETRHGQNRHSIDLPKNQASSTRHTEISKPRPGVAR